tara:strand:+ start:7166 stop:7828 length:663 start_codon:yes stop_codon:yes gene_type:complete
MVVQDESQMEGVRELLKKHANKSVDDEWIEYLQKIAQELVNQSSELRGFDVHVYIGELRGVKGLNRTLPGIDIYLDPRLLKGIEFENELAALVALELGHLIQRHAVQKLSEAVPGEFSSLNFEDKKKLLYGEDSLFIFDVNQMKRSIRSAVKLLYQRQYDVRGLDIVIRRFVDQGAHRLFRTRDRERLVDEVHRSISKFPPLRHPIVQTERFKKIKNRIK